MADEMIVIPETVDTAVVTAPVAKPESLSFKAEDFAADIAKLAAEQGVTVSPKVEPPTQPEQPVTQAPVTPPVEATKVEVPVKFQTPDGGVDTEKLAKSTMNVEEALAKYLEKERELARKRNEVKAQENAYINPPTPPNTPTPVIPVNTNFAAQLEADIAKEGAGVVLAKLFTAAQESVEERVQKEISSLKNVNAENTIKQQIQAIGKSDPWVYTTEGISTLNQVLIEQPYLQTADDPYKAAYLFYNGQKSVASKSSPQVLTPTPIARPSAPVPTGQAASQANNGMTPEAMFDKLTPGQKVEFINRLPPNEQEKWFVKAGFPAFNARR